MSGQTTQTAEVLDGQELDRVKETAIKGLLALIKIEADDTTYMRGIETGRMNREIFIDSLRKIRLYMSEFKKYDGPLKNLSDLRDEYPEIFRLVHKLPKEPRFDSGVKFQQDLHEYLRK